MKKLSRLVQVQDALLSTLDKQISVRRPEHFYLYPGQYEIFIQWIKRSGLYSSSPRKNGNHLYRGIEVIRLPGPQAPHVVTRGAVR
jgi:hypothetical protein